jgi:tRNA modification GTPase
MILDGIVFRFIDTAGLRETEDAIEAIGVGRTRERMKKASLILYMFDLSNTTLAEIQEEERELEMLGKPIIKVGNKLDKAPDQLVQELLKHDFVFISASHRIHVDELKQKLVQRFHVEKVKMGDVLVTNLRHFQNLSETNATLDRVLYGMDNKVTGDLLAMDIRQALHYLGEITGAITTEDLLENIFSKFCIGK